MFTALRGDLELSGALLTGVRRTSLVETQQETRRFLAVLALRSRQHNIAEELYRSCLSEKPQLPIQALLYDGLLRVLWAARKHDAVVDVCRKGLAEANELNQLPFHGNLARALVVLGKTKEAIAAADQAVALSDAGNRLAYRLLRVEILTMARDYSQAESSCNELLQETIAPPDIRRIRYVLSNIYTTSRAYEKAEEQLRLILRDDPDDATANNDLGYIMADQGRNLEEAEQMIRRALDIDDKKKQSLRATEGEDEPANAAFVDSLGWVLFRKGQFEEARHELERAVALPDGGADPVVWDHLGDVYFRLGDAAKARQSWEKARVLYEGEKRRALDDQYNELKRKLRQSEPEAKHRGIFKHAFWVFDWMKR
jgi:tetratricopeptide (TPR) repeat protein